MTTDDVRINEIRAREAAATPGPWQVTAHSHLVPGCRCLSCHDDPTGYLVDHSYAGYCDDGMADLQNIEDRNRESCQEGPLLSFADADFAAHARGDIAWLLHQYDLLQEALSSTEQVLTDSEAELLQLKGSI